MDETYEKLMKRLKDENIPTYAMSLKDLKRTIHILEEITNENNESQNEHLID